MANVYTNYKAVLSNTNLTTLYTVPAQTTAIIKSVRVANVDTSNNCEVSLYLVDTGTTSYTLQLSRDIESKTTQELLAAGNSSQVSADSSTSSIAPLVAKESEIIKIQAENANDLHVVLSVLEICLLYTSPSPRDGLLSRMPSSA